MYWYFYKRLFILFCFIYFYTSDRCCINLLILYSIDLWSFCSFTRSGIHFSRLKCLTINFIDSVNNNRCFVIYSTIINFTSIINKILFCIPDRKVNNDLYASPITFCNVVEKTCFKLNFEWASRKKSLVSQKRLHS